MKPIIIAIFNLHVMSAGLSRACSHLFVIRQPQRRSIEDSNMVMAFVC